MSLCFFFSSRRRHTRLQGDWSSDVCSSDLRAVLAAANDYTSTMNNIEPSSYSLAPDEALAFLVRQAQALPRDRRVAIGIARSEERRVGNECGCVWSSS